MFETPANKTQCRAAHERGVGNGTFQRGAMMAWITYDVASSGYVLLMTAIAFPIYFKTVIAQGAPWSDALWGVLLTSASIAAGLLAPVTGHAADLKGTRWRQLSWLTAVSCAAALGLAIPGLGVMPAAAIFFLSLTAYHLAGALYDSLLPSLVSRRNAAILSSTGWGLGYVGGLLCYGLVLAMVTLGEWDGGLTNRDAILVAAVYYSVLCCMSLLGMRAFGQMEHERPAASVLRVAGWSISGHLRRFRAHPIRDRIVGTGLVSGSATAVGLFSPLLFHGQFGLSVGDVGLLGLLFSVTAIPSTLLAGFLASRIGELRIFVCLLPMWLMTMFLLSTGSGWQAGILAAFCLGLVIGPTNAIARSLIAGVTVKTEAAATFGYAALFNRLVGAWGPMCFGTLASVSGDRFMPLTVAALTMVAGFFLLHERRGKT